MVGGLTVKESFGYTGTMMALAFYNCERSLPLQIAFWLFRQGCFFLPHVMLSPGYCRTVARDTESCKDLS